ncbi:Non-POU domain-containing octamer-binding protein, partial [Galemys pyrenaicus]
MRTVGGGVKNFRVIRPLTGEGKAYSKEASSYHHQHHKQQWQLQPLLLPITAQGQQASIQNEGLTTELKTSRKSGDKTLIQSSWFFVGNLPPDITRTVVIVNNQGRPSGKDTVELLGKPALWKALDRCSKILSSYLHFQGFNHWYGETTAEQEDVPEKLEMEMKISCNECQMMLNKPLSCQMEPWDRPYQQLNVLTKVLQCEDMKQLVGAPYIQLCSSW